MQSTAQLIDISTKHQNNIIDSTITINLSNYCHAIISDANWQDIKNNIGDEIDTTGAVFKFIDIIGDKEANKDFLWYNILIAGSFGELLKNACDAKLNQWFQNKNDFTDVITKFKLKIEKNEHEHLIIIEDNAGGFPDAKINTQSEYFDRIRNYQFEEDSLSTSKTNPNAKYLFGGQGKGLDMLTSLFLHGAARDAKSWRKMYDLKDFSNDISYCNSKDGAIIKISCSSKPAVLARGIVEFSYPNQVNDNQSEHDDEFVLPFIMWDDNLGPVLDTAKKQNIENPINTENNENVNPNFSTGKKIQNAPHTPIRVTKAISHFGVFSPNPQSPIGIRRRILSNNNTPIKNK